MAAKEMWDYLSAVTPDYASTLDVRPNGGVREHGFKNQEVLTADDNSEVVISYSDDSIFHVTLQFTLRDEATTGTLLDWYHDAAKANGIERSFIWTNYSEPTASRHDYVVRFSSEFEREIERGNKYGVYGITLRVLGQYVP